MSDLSLSLTREDPWWFGHIDGELIVQAREREFAVEALCRAVRRELDPAKPAYEQVTEGDL